ncbi:MAG: UDP-N-acetylmuramoyl-tripeptide--D-alanyl-D-alanine ligase [Chitinophagales bacterium]
MELNQLYQLYLKCNGICTDTRKIGGGEMFFALKGPNFNANKLALTALANGCAYAVVDELLEEENGRLIKVDDALATLQQLANFHRRQFDIPVIGITGSNGKTTNKELINSVLSKKYRFHCKKGNLNNHIGVPLTLLELNSSHEITIIEMGANHVGEIKELSEIAEPTHGLITSIGIAHLEGFGSVEGIKKGKKELYDYVLKHNGICFVNQHTSVVPDLYEGGESNVFYYGNSSHLPYVVIGQSKPTLSLEAITSHGSFKIASNLIGEFQSNNILNAFAIGDYFKVEEASIVEAIEAYHPKNNRSQQMEWNSNLVILDAYNANPTSMEAAIHSFVSSDTHNKVVIIGDMLELGEASLDYHQKIVEQLKDHSFDQVILVGSEFMKTEIPDHFVPFEGTQSAKAFVKNQNYQQKTILVKGSRGIGLEKIFD